MCLFFDDFLLHSLPTHMIIVNNRYGPTALHLAASRGHLNMVKYLVSIGAEVDNSNSDMRIIFGDTPLGERTLVFLCPYSYVYYANLIYHNLTTTTTTTYI